MQTPFDLSLYVVTDRRAARDRPLLDVVRAAIAGGVTLVQLRDKNMPTHAMIMLGRALHELTQAAGIPLIVNDRVDVALAIGAEGVHVGQDDMPTSLARELIGPERILGVSAASVLEARQATRDGADYLGVGDLFGTPSKADAGTPIGLEPLQKIRRAVALPLVGIGGITPANAAEVIAAGADGVAVISAVVSAPDPTAAALQLRTIVDDEYNRRIQREYELGR